MQRLIKSRRAVLSVLALFGLAALAGCGGGGSNSGNTKTVTGVVRDGAGRPISGVTITVGGRTTTTNASGQYTLPGVSSTTAQVLTASKAGYQTYTTTVQPGQSSVSIILVPGTGGTRTLSGTVKDAVTAKAIRGATVSVGSASTTTDGAGLFRITGLATGALTVTVSATGYASKTVTVPSGQNTINVSLTNTNGPPDPPVFP